MFSLQEYHIPITPKTVRSLQWHNETLYDWVGGGDAYFLDGRKEQRRVNYAYRFDAAIISPSGQYVVLYERLGTKAILLKQGRILRELNRSFYHAAVYAYPITFLRLPDGREVLVHCPDDYCRLEFEEVETGEILTKRDNKPVDIFYSRLAASLSGRFLLMAGWVWHPVDVFGVYDVATALHSPDTLDGYGITRLVEVSAAAFVDDSTVAMVTADEMIGDDNDPGPRTIAYYDLDTGNYLSQVIAEERVGAILPIGSRYLAGFYGYPRLFDRFTGEVVHRWPELATGTEMSSIQIRSAGEKPPPVFAIDPQHGRFAVAGEERITVMEIKSF